MKRTISIILALILSFSFSSCAGIGDSIFYENTAPPQANENDKILIGPSIGSGVLEDDLDFEYNIDDLVCNIVEVTPISSRAPRSVTLKEEDAFEIYKMLTSVSYSAITSEGSTSLSMTSIFVEFGYYDEYGNQFVIDSGIDTGTTFTVNDVSMVTCDCSGEKSQAWIKGMYEVLSKELGRTVYVTYD